MIEIHIVSAAITNAVSAEIHRPDRDRRIDTSRRITSEDAVLIIDKPSPATNGQVSALMADAGPVAIGNLRALPGEVGERYIATRHKDRLAVANILRSNHDGHAAHSDQVQMAFRDKAGVVG